MLRLVQSNSCRVRTSPWERKVPVMKTRQLCSSVFTLLLIATSSSATVTITDCRSDQHCAIQYARTMIDAPDDAVVIAGALTPLPGTDAITVRAGSVAIDGVHGGSITATGPNV